MSAKLLSGTDVSQAIKDRLQEQVNQILIKNQPRPKLVVLLVGNHPASVSYVTKKKQDALAVGFLSEVKELSNTISQMELLQEIRRCNEDSSIHGILVQLPLPKHIENEAVINAIDPAKDVDGFHPINVGRFHTNQPSFVPCTPKGVLTLLQSTGVPLAGKHALVIGRSNIVGKPVALLLLAEDMTVTIAHSKTSNIKAMALQADVIVAAVGKPAFVKADWVKPGAIVIDVGINRMPLDGGKTKLIGDVDFDAIKEIASWITPVPGGVGPMTIASLLENTMQAYEKAQR
jgi:methylenetetrahydrofolate dehydrogenase (NADP+) / methenyltetrahydrofolate cyclohydrolase